MRLASLIIMIAWQCPVAEAAPHSLDAVLGFAQSLQAEGEYYCAITEYKRVLYLAPPENRVLRDTAIMGIGGALFSGAEYALSAEWMRVHVGNLGATAIKSDGMRLMYRSLLADGDGLRLLEVSRELGDNSREAAFYQGLAHANAGNWSEAAVRFDDLRTDEQFGATAAEFAELSRDGEHTAWKSPRTAVALGVVPGLGYWYAGFRQTGIASLLVNGLFIGATVQAFRSDQSLLGGFLTLFSVSWYAGNVYGSGIAAKHKNESLQRELWERFQF